MSLDSIHTTQSEEATESLGRALAADLRGQKVLLYGDLGLGKTAFVRGLAAGLGSSARVKSPTFVIERIYPISDYTTLAHLDLYRLGQVGPELAAHLRSLWLDPAQTVALEWPERLPPELLPVSRIELHFSDLGSGVREIRVLQIG